MRFLLFDRVLHFEEGRRIVASKAFSMQDEALRGHFPRSPLVPGALLVEAMLQTLGWLILRTHGFKVLPLFSMMEDATVASDLAPGVLLQVEGELDSTHGKGSMGRAVVRHEGRVVASIGRVLFGHYPVPDPEALRRTFSVYGRLA